MMTRNYTENAYDDLLKDVNIYRKLKKKSVKCPHCDYLFLLGKPQFNFETVMLHTKLEHPKIYIEAMVKTAT